MYFIVFFQSVLNLFICLCKQLTCLYSYYKLRVLGVSQISFHFIILSHLFVSQPCTCIVQDLIRAMGKSLHTKFGHYLSGSVYSKIPFSFYGVYGYPKPCSLTPQAIKNAGFLTQF